MEGHNSSNRGITDKDLIPTMATDTETNVDMAEDRLKADRDMATVTNSSRT